jgi:hypothetical protein
MAVLVNGPPYLRTPWDSFLYSPQGASFCPRMSVRDVPNLRHTATAGLVGQWSALTDGADSGPRNGSMPARTQERATTTSISTGNTRPTPVK